MIHLLTDALPEHIEADGRRYSVLTDFRDWLRFSEMLHDRTLLPEEKAGCMVWWVDDPPERVTAGFVEAMLAFCRGDALDAEKSEESDEDAPARPPVFDWKVDARYAVGDFRRFYGMDLLRIEYLHWWELLALFTALPDESVCKQRIGYRACDLSRIRNKSEKQRIAAIQKRIALPWEPEEDTFGEALWNTML